MNNSFIFVRGEAFNKEEEDSVEFKEITSQRPTHKIANHAEEYVLGFINAHIEGDIYFGIDDSGVIKGVTLKRSDRDEIRRDIPNKLKSTDPEVPFHYYQVIIHDVFDESHTLIQDLHIVQIHVIKTSEKLLYRTSGGSYYHRKGSSSNKLSSAQAYQEMRSREQMRLQIEATRLDEELLKHPNNRKLLKDRIQVALFMNEIETLYKLYERLLTLDPQNPDIRIDYATAHERIGDSEGALSILNDAIQSNINNSSILKNKGLILTDLERLPEAYQSYSEALKLNPNDPTIIIRIGILLRQMGKYKDSIECFNCLLKESPNYRAAKYEKKKTYYEMFKKSW